MYLCLWWLFELVYILNFRYKVMFPIVVLQNCLSCELVPFDPAELLIHLRVPVVLFGRFSARRTG